MDSLTRLAHAAIVFGVLGSVSFGAAAQVIPALPTAGEEEETMPTRAEDLVWVRVAGEEVDVVAGKTVEIPVIFKIAPEWHIYWINSGAAGTPTEFTVRAPKPLKVETPLFPRPIAIPEKDGVVYGYEEETVIFLPVSTPADCELGTREVAITVHYLVCREACLIGSAEFKTTVNVVAPGQSGADGESAEEADPVVKRHRARVPVAPDRETRVRWMDDVLVIEGVAREAQDIIFFPVETPGVTFGKPVLEHDGNRYRLAVPAPVRWQNTTGKRAVVHGVVGLGADEDDPAIEVILPMTAPEVQS